MTILENISLAPLTTFKAGGRARYFAEAETVEDLREAVLFAREQNLPFFVLGGGSNVLVSDSGFPGLVVKVSLRGIEHKISGDRIIVTAMAGEVWDDLVSYSVLRGWHGIENLSGIPGTAGAAPIQNIGCYGVEVKDVVESVTALDVKKMEVRVFSKEECEFAYRNSFFKRDSGKSYIVVSITFILGTNIPLVFKYEDVKDYFAASGKEEKEVSLAEMREAILSIRKRKLPPLERYGTAGSFFKNPVVSTETYAKLSEKYPDLPSYKAEIGFVKLPAAYLIDRIAGLRALRHGDVGTYENQALVLTNYGNAKAKEIKLFSEEIAFAVKNKTGIELESEVDVVGEF